MYQWCKAGRANRHEHEGSEDAELAGLESRTDHDYDVERTEDSNLPTDQSNYVRY